ncbi:hypothetical protein ACSNOK_15750 [Streptomyces sp. URMC 126]|uniref:hypothetical protein n=1 Tax=Streptomyces sp. URMC 126 TaxID=3423401 RepID=UPI003F1DE733
MTLALGLTVLLGVQSAELARLRRLVDDPGEARPHVSTTVVAAIPVVTVVVAVTGGALLGRGFRGGPWVGAGVFSCVIIIAAAFWTLRALRATTPERPRTTAGLAAVQWGTPAFTMGATFLMAARPDNAGIAVAPVVLAALVTAAAFRRGGTVAPVSA